MTADVVSQLRQSGHFRYVKSFTVDRGMMHGHVETSILDSLMHDERFAHGIYYGLHTDVGENLYDFRSYRSAFGKGSLQLVIDGTTGRFYADVDRFNPYADIVNIVGHMFGEVLPHWFRRIF